MDSQEVLDDILENPPETVEEVLEEAPILIVVGDEDNADEIIDRFFLFSFSFFPLFLLSSHLLLLFSIVSKNQLILFVNKVTLKAVMSSEILLLMVLETLFLMIILMMLTICWVMLRFLFFY